MTDKPRFRLGFLTHVQGRGDPAATYRNAQELFVVADELGFDVGWVAQHHAPLGGGGLPSPWTFLAHAAAQRFSLRGAFPQGISQDEALRRFHAFYGHPDEIIAALGEEKVLPVATDLITQFNPAVPDHDAAIRALELIATEVAPALGWKPAVAQLAGA
jgi:alkanesulfonate monooxygenase SsuD/methylene tetrahydromethanopterin reductase-like flavin-dependent oxidoreductase (luciferase family)